MLPGVSTVSYQTGTGMKGSSAFPLIFDILTVKQQNHTAVRDFLLPYPDLSARVIGLFRTRPI